MKKLLNFTFKINKFQNKWQKQVQKLIRTIKKNKKRIPNKQIQKHNKQYQDMKIQAKYYFFAQYKMSEKALKFGDVETNKKKNHAFNQPITLNLVDKDTIVITDFKHKGSKYFICYNDDKLLDLYVLFYLK